MRRIVTAEGPHDPVTVLRRRRREGSHPRPTVLREAHRGRPLGRLELDHVVQRHHQIRGDVVVPVAHLHRHLIGAVGVGVVGLLVVLGRTERQYPRLAQRDRRRVRSARLRPDQITHIRVSIRRSQSRHRRRPLSHHERTRARDLRSSRALPPAPATPTTPQRSETPTQQRSETPTHQPRPLAAPTRPHASRQHPRPRRQHPPIQSQRRHRHQPAIDVIELRTRRVHPSTPPPHAQTIVIAITCVQVL